MDSKGRFCYCCLFSCCAISDASWTTDAKTLLPDDRHDIKLHVASFVVVVVFFLKTRNPPPVWLCFVHHLQPNVHCLVDFRQKPESESSLAFSHCSSPLPPPLSRSPPTPPHLHSLQFLLNYLLNGKLFTVRSKHFFLRSHLNQAPYRI
jgi:hypothetical protein